MKRHYPNWLEAFVEYGGYGEAPRDVIFWTGVSSIAAALRRNVWFDMGYFRWYPNHYIVFVAKPGIIGKSTTMGIGQKLLREVPGIKFGPDVITWQALVTSMSEAREDVGFIGADGETEYVASCSLTIMASELGNLIDMRNSEMVNILITMYDAEDRTFEKKTKTVGDDQVPNPWLNFIACTTPSWIATGFDELSIQGGFASRCLFVFADAKRDLIAYPKRHMPPDLSHMRTRLIEDLEAITFMRGEFRMTEEAYEFGEALYRKHWNGGSDAPDKERLGGYWARKQAHLHKLAMVLSAAESNQAVITLKHLEAAHEWVTKTEANLARVFELVGRSSDAKLANEILAFVGRLGMVTRADLHAHFLAHYGKEEVSRGVDSCFAAGKLIGRDIGGEVYLSVPKGNPPTSPQSPSAAPVQTPAPAAAQVTFQTLAEAHVFDVPGDSAEPSPQ